MKLYKYRRFSEFLIRELCDSTIYFSDPRLFNDPLDCSPSIINDLDNNQLEQLCYWMMTDYRDEQYARDELSRFRYYASEEDGQDDFAQSHAYQMTYAIRYYLDEKMKKKGVLSLSARNNSQLMWSHYADEHKGICLEFDMNGAVREPRCIDYNGNRGINASLIRELFGQSHDEALRKIEQMYYFTKANDWQYESEWRMLENESGEHSIPFNLTGVYFGMRCHHTIKKSIMKLLYNKGSKISFFEMYPNTTSFELHSRELEPQEYISCIPRPSVALAFGRVPIINTTS